jgi:molybdenum cofactor guanylyltransferase
MTDLATPFHGAVLAGGSSRRMGTDKAFVEIDGVPLVSRCAAALHQAGARSVEIIGGDRPRLQALGLTVVDDRVPGAGPLGGLISVLERHVHDQAVVVLPCDLRHPSPTALAAVAAALGPDAGDGSSPAVAVPQVDGRRQWLHAAWRPGAALPGLLAAFEAGERAVHRAAAGLSVVVVSSVGTHDVDDVDTPGDLPDTPGGELAWERPG